MNYNDIENLMFTFMNYINESDIPITFKGSMVLKALLKESGYNEK